MRTLTIIILILFGKNSLAQSDSVLISIIDDLERIVEPRLENDSTFSIVVKLDSNKNLIAYNKNDQFRIIKIFERIKSSLKENYLYSYYFFKDGVSDKLFSSFFYEEFGFINYEVPASYPGGINAFLKIFLEDLNGKIDKNKIDQYNWNKPISFIVRKDGSVQFLEDNNFAEIIDIHKFKKWQPAIYMGVPINQFFKTDPINKEKYLNEGKVEAELYSFDILDSLFKEQPVYIENYNKPDTSDVNILLSYVFARNTLEEPRILKGDRKLANQLIEFIQESVNKENYLTNRHKPRRIFVFLKD